MRGKNNSKMDSLNFFKQNLEEMLIEIKGLFKYSFFISKKEKQKHLNRFKKGVEKYLPLIEKRIGIDLGEIKVKPYALIIDDVYNNYLNNFFGLKYNANNLDKKIAKGVIYCFKPFLELNRMLNEEKCRASYRNSIIYVPFGIMTKTNLFVEFMHGQTQIVEEIVVHELTHGVWEKINNPYDEKDRKNLKLWSEGFATYGQLEWFSDFYPISQSHIHNNFFYMQGKSLVQDVVKKYGEEILLEIPKKWQEFDKEFN